MFRPNWKLLLIGAVVAASLTAGASRADAYWWGYYRPVAWGYSYYTPCYTPYYTVSCDPCGYANYGWYVGFRPGPVRRLLFGPYRWYYGGRSYWSPGYYDVCCTDVGTAAVPATTGPATKGAPTPAPKPPTEAPDAEPPAVPGDSGTGLPGGLPGLRPDGGLLPGLGPDEGPLPGPGPEEPPLPGPGPDDRPLPESGAVPSREGKGLLTLSVPLGTKVFINGVETKSTSGERQYVSYGLKPGFEYKYEIVAHVLCERKMGPIVVERKKIPLTRTVFLRAGDHEHLTFTSDVVTIPDEITGADRVVVVDDLLKQMQREASLAKRVGPSPRPPEWSP